MLFGPGTARTVLDLGSGEGKLLREILRDRQFEQIVGMDVSIRPLEMAQKRLKLDRLPDRQAERLKLIHGSLIDSLLFATISGAHRYGFPSPDSDYDPRGVHPLPIREVTGL